MGAEVSQEAGAASEQQQGTAPPASDADPPADLPPLQTTASAPQGESANDLNPAPTVRRSNSSTNLNVPTTLADASSMSMYEARQESRHARASTWQHRGQRRRAYVHAPWPAGARSGGAHSDTESDGGMSESSC